MAELAALKLRQRAAATGALVVIGNDLAGEGARHAPVDESTLRASGDVDVVEIGDGVWVIVSFSTPYAQRQHEELSYRHPRGGEPKFLEGPFKAKLPRYAAVLAAAVRKAT